MVMVSSLGTRCIRRVTEANPTLLLRRLWWLWVNVRQIYVRWPAQSSDSKYPRIMTMHLEHNHDVDREAVNAKEAQLGAVSTPMKEPSAKLTGMLCYVGGEIDGG